MDMTSSSQPVYKGRLGRTAKTSVLITSDVGAMFSANIHTSINVKDDPELAQKLNSGALNTVDCPFTESVYALAVPVYYHDPDARLFVLVVPGALRHDEMRLRTELLQALGKEREVIPPYVRQFHVVFDPTQIEALKQPAAQTEAAVVPPPPAQSLQEQVLDQEREQLEQAREQLKVEQQQLADVSERLERERERMEEVEGKIVREREALEQERNEFEQARRNFEVQKLNFEESKMRLEQQGAAPVEEKTQIVTDDQFIEIVGEQSVEDIDPVLDEGEILGGASSKARPSFITSSLMEESVLDDDIEDELGPEEHTFVTALPSLDSAEVPAKFDTKLSGGQDYYTTVINDLVVAAVRTTKRQVDAIIDAQTPQFFVQYSVIENYPLMSLLLAQLDEQNQHVASFAWPLDISVKRDKDVIDALIEQTAVRFAFYDGMGKLLRTFDVVAELERNVEWIKSRAHAYWTNPKRKSGRFGKAADVYMASGYERLGSMRHAFHDDSFAEIHDAASAKLAAGIVGYWSTEDVYDYLIGNRAFPLQTFEAIQTRVVKAALNFGIYLNAPLRQFAVDQSLADSPKHATNLLFANFAEVSTGLKESGLDPVETWENWDALFSLAEELDVQPDEDILKLAQASLERAQAFEEGEEVQEEQGGERTMIIKVPVNPELSTSEAVEELVVARYNEATGVTYFLPDGAIMDVFEDYDDMSKDDLLLMLDDANGRLNAAQVLIERFGAPVVSDVLGAAENMQASEVASLAKFVESKADGLEGELVRCVENGGPSATYIAAHGLVSVASTSAIPVLLSALRDKKRQGNRKLLAQKLAEYGDKIVPPLVRSIKRDGHDEAISQLLGAIESVERGTLGKLAKDRHKKVREAAKDARAFVQ